MVRHTYGPLRKVEMSTIRKHYKKWQALVRKKGKVVAKSFYKKSDASKWAYKVEAQLETGTYQRVEQAEKLADSLAQTMTRLVGIQEEIIEAYKSVQQAQNVNVEMDGGNFSDKK